MNILLLGTSFLAGVLTILAPCVLPLLPVIIGSTAGSKNTWKPFIVTASLAISIVAFTILLKASTVFIDIPQGFWTSISGGIILFFGIFLLLPGLWEKINLKLKFSKASQTQLNKAGSGESLKSSILIGAALGPVFSSCSPTYFVILATVLPANFSLGLVYLSVYALGIMLALGSIGFFGQKLIKKLGWATNPNGWFKKIMGILLILVGLAVVTGFEKKIETSILNAGYDITGIEESLLNNMNEQTPSTTPDEDKGSLPYLYEAPELSGLSGWINSEPIESMEELKGKVVLIDFWTYSCINCIRTLPYIQTWHEKYEEDGLVIIAIHAPEFQFEKKLENVQDAVDEFELTYPVVQDNDFKTWRAYENHYWPSKYLIDKDGVVRYNHYGEGKYEETEQAIVELLGTSMKSGDVKNQYTNYKEIDTPETYIGLRRRENYVDYGNSEKSLTLNQWTLTGEWKQNEENATTKEKNSSIIMHFKASKANLVIGGSGKANIYIDGKPSNESNGGKDVKEGQLIIDGERLYELTDFNDKYEEHEIKIEFLQPGISIYAWTFG